MPTTVEFLIVVPKLDAVTELKVPPVGVLTVYTSVAPDVNVLVWDTVPPTVPELIVPPEAGIAAAVKVPPVGVLTEVTALACLPKFKSSRVIPL